MYEMKASCEIDIESKAGELASRLEGAHPCHVIETALLEEPEKLAVVSSFGAESAVLLDMVSSVSRSIPVIFLDTGHSFPETLAYVELLTDKLKLQNVQTVTPDFMQLQSNDPDGFLWQSNPDQCCHLRKVVPLERALSEFRAWINGRKRYQASTRDALPVVEADRQKLKFNPLASWSRDDIGRHFAQRNLPRHPLEALGFLSIGCMPCTSRTKPGEDARAGRWRGQAKTECGIHVNK